MNNELLIWWVSGMHLARMGEPHYYRDDPEYWDSEVGRNTPGILFLDDTPLPEYIGRELTSRSGRAGRARLWVPDGIDLEGIEWPENNPTAERIAASSCGGIVFYRKDLEVVKTFLGFVTDLRLNLV